MKCCENPDDSSPKDEEQLHKVWKNYQEETELSQSSCVHTWYAFHWMIDHTRQLANIIINKVATTSEKYNRKIYQQCDAIVTKIISITESTFAILELQNYVDVLRRGALVQLKVRVSHVLFCRGKNSADFNGSRIRPMQGMFETLTHEFESKLCNHE
ncbi:hypothetical protein UY3_15985 [Chelonia mydas]|uniref:Uncharacterized protein n=1 Tax=Chelonia mydas TaxID=8469 RepID=M7B458_CHEMY|nr:hypothetical protein UY3_15985 [Chelonia mydas]